MADGDGGFWDTVLSAWWGQVLFGLAFFLGAYFAYAYLADLEEVGGRRKVWWLIALLYNLVGKFGTAAVIAVPGLLLTLLGVRTLSRQIRGVDDD